MSLEVAIVRYPGSNCDFDTKRFFERGGHNAQFLWHEETKVPDTDLLVLPGGFAFGDRVYTKATGSFILEPGIKALESPVMEVVHKWAEDGKPILGICNGFQILVHAGILPGQLLRNENNQFFCDDVDCSVEGSSFFEDPTMLGNIYRINVAHGYGRFGVKPADYQRLLDNNQIFLRYHGFNPNGSYENIAGICNEHGNVYGMMPHPERTTPEVRNIFLQAIESYVRN